MLSRNTNASKITRYAVLISMTEAVAYALHCLGLHTSLKPAEALIYLYDGRMVGLSSQAAVGSTIGSTKTCHNLYGTKLRHPDHQIRASSGFRLMYKPLDQHISHS